MSNDEQSTDTDDSDDDGRSASDQLLSAVVDPQVEMCEVCLIQPRDVRHALVPCGHQCLCTSCVTQIQQQGRRFKYVPQQHQSDFVFTSDTLDTLFGQYIDVILPTMSLYSNISVILIERFYLIFLHPHQHQSYR